MKRRDFVAFGAGASALALTDTLRAVYLEEPGLLGSPVVKGAPLEAPASGKIKVAVAIADHATVIDFAGPWEVFQDVMVPSRGNNHGDQMPFELFTVAATTDPIRATAGLHIIPDYSFDDSPQPDLVVVPALQGSPALHEWLAAVAPETDVTMSVCTGAFQLARAGLLNGQIATTHHDFYDAFAKQFPKIQLERGLRFVENEKISTAGGLTSGIDLSLRVVERYFGRSVAQRTADYMEYKSTGWKV